MAILVLGLRENSRVKMKMSGTRLNTEQILLAMMADSLQFLAWSKTKDAKKGKYKNKSILKTLQGEYQKNKDDLQSFESPEEFERYMSQFIK